MINRDIPFTKETYMLTALKHLLLSGNLVIVSGSNETSLLDNTYKLSEKVTVTEW
jgi:hypothetical protein